MDYDYPIDVEKMFRSVDKGIVFGLFLGCFWVVLLLLI